MSRAITIYDYTCSGVAGRYDPEEGWDEETLLTVPAKLEICCVCNGEGVHDHPAFSDGIAMDSERWQDYDFQEEYMSGAYDVCCSGCRGKRVIEVPDWDAMTERQRELAEQYWQQLSDHEAEVAAERRMGA